MKKVIKRNGNEETFDKNKIINAVCAAFNDVDNEISDFAKAKASDIANYISRMEDNISVEEIQDIVEDKLMACNRKDVARAYIRYRYKREMLRNTDSDLMKEIKEKVMASNVQNQNANVDEHSFGGRMGEARNSIMKKYALDYLMSDLSKNNHLNNEVYVHDLDSYAVGEHNCLERKTSFITSNGIRTFENFEDGEEVVVLDRFGEWRKATVHCYGRRKIQDVVFERAGEEITIGCTDNHRWYLKDGSVTENLSVGDSIYPLEDMKYTLSIDTKEDAELWCLGFILGDGVDHYNQTEVRLCGEKIKYLDIFKQAFFKHRGIDNGDIFLWKSLPINKQYFLDNKLWKLLSLKQKQLLFNGYISADGNGKDQLGCATSDKRVLEFIKDTSCLSGFHIKRVNLIVHDTNFKKDAMLWCVRFTKSHHNICWKVKSITKRNHCNDTVWCIEEPITHSFTLTGGIITGNCLTIPFDDLLKNGFNTRQADVRPANSINTAMQLVAVIFQLQSLQQFGGVSASHLDWTMVPYVRKSFYKHFKDGFKYIYEKNEEIGIDHPEDKSIEDEFYKQYDKAYKYAMDLTIKETQQAVEGMYHNLNTLQSRSGNQLPFTSINYGTCTLPEGRMVTKALLEGSLKGVGKVHKTPIFPCGIFQCMKGVNRKEGEPNYDLFKLALKSTAKRLYPNYANVDWSVNEGYDRNDPRTYVATMGCRTYNGKDINAEPGVNPQIKDGRGNIAPVTIIMPTLAMEAEGNVDKFFEILDTKIHEAKEMLVERYKHIISQDPSSAKFMYENGLMLGYDGKTVESAMKHGTLVIGQLGLAETLQILIGKNHTTPEGMELAKRIEQLFKDRCAQFKQELHLNIGVYYTPAENLCYTAMKKFKDKYGVIKNVSDRDYFTNSMHVPVWEKMSPFDKIDIEAELTGYSNAGCITYIELDSGAKNNLEALETIVNYAMDKDIPYFAINVPNDTCLDCGYCDEFNDHCPECGSHNIQQLRRVTGYLTGDYKSAFNYGKQKEVEDRYKHSKKLEEWK